MSTYELLMCVPLLGLLVLAAVVDVRSRRLPNWLTLGLIVTGLAHSFMAGRTVSPLYSLAGAAVGFALPFALFAIDALGGGDVKLLTGIGAWLGPRPVFEVFLAAAIVGLVIVLVQAAATGRIRLLMRNSALLALNLVHVQELGVEHVSATGQSHRSIGRPLPYAVPVLLGTAAVLAQAWLSGS